MTLRSEGDSAAFTRTGLPAVRAVLLDLDGTLVDSLPDIARAVNILLHEEGRAHLTLDDVRGMVGHGIATLVKRAVDARGGVSGPQELARLVARMMEIYGANLTGGTRLLPGAAALLHGLADSGAALALVTNKPEAMSRRILEHFGLASLIPVVVGGDTCKTRKPDPEMLFHALALLDIVPGQAVMLGDSAADIDAARAAGMRSIVLAGGYGHGRAEDLGADALVTTLDEAGAVLGAWRKASA
jgi:phosphoglycolate phosphatase